MKILGIDPGYGIVGYGIVETDGNIFRAVDFGVVETPKDMSLSERLTIIYDSVCDLIKKYKPDDVAVEELFYFKNQKTFIQVAQARGVIIAAAKKSCEKVYEYTPLQIKQALTGYGRAEKQQMQYMVKNILELDKIPKPDDAADALAVAVTHGQTSKVISNFTV